MASVMPMIVVDDIEAVSDYYRNALEFEQTATMKMPDGSTMMIIVDNGNDAALMFNAAHPESPAPNPLNPDGMAIFLTTEDVDAYHAKLAGKSEVKIVEGLTDQFWGDRTFVVQDPNGLHLWFAQHTGNMSPPPEGFEVDMAQPAG